MGWTLSAPDKNVVIEKLHLLADNSILIPAWREHFINSMRKSGMGKESRLAFLDENEGIILIEVSDSMESGKMTTIY